MSYNQLDGDTIGVDDDILDEDINTYFLDIENGVILWLTDHDRFGDDVVMD